MGCRDTDLHSGGSYGAVLARHQKKKNSEAVGKLEVQDLCRLMGYWTRDEAPRRARFH